MNNNNNKALEDLNYAQKQRLAFIDFLLMFKGSFTRNDLTSKFEMGMANATRDIALYRELSPSNSDFDNSSKTYIQNKNFKPLFNYEPRKTLTKLANNISDGFDGVMEVAFPVEAPLQLNVPDINIVAKLVQAVLNKKAISIIYTSLSSGSKTREIIPHTIVDNGLRWHVRAFDRNTNSFRDFVITRISKVTLLEQPVEEFEKEVEDNQWMRKIDLHIVPHPTNIQYPQAIELDYGMEKALLQITVRAALVGYLLRRWNVDCTETGSLKGGEYQLWLRNKQTLYGAENLTIAPGYKL
jgi:predicted DNA-binding transcriptional regulator YafY